MQGQGSAVQGQKGAVQDQGSAVQGQGNVAQGQGNAIQGYILTRSGLRLNAVQGEELLSSKENVLEHYCTGSESAIKHVQGSSMVYSPAIIVASPFRTTNAWPKIKATTITRTARERESRKS